MKKYLTILMLMTVAFTGTIYAQKAGLKTNLLYWSTTTPNIGAEVRLADRFTLNLEGGYNPFTLNDNNEVNKKIKHFLVSPEVRYWFCDRFTRHFLGFHALAGQYNIGGLKNNFKFLGTDFSQLSNNRFQGWGAGAGIAYGYAMILGKHWNLEFELGVGYIYSAYDIFECSGCGRRVGTDTNHYVGLTKAAINLVYLF